MNKIIGQEKLPDLIKKLNSKKVVLAGGVFDILHPAHVEFLQEARKEGDILIILLESDESVKNSKGKNRPVFPQNERAQVLEALEPVNYIVLLNGVISDEGYSSLTKLIKPAIIAASDQDPLLEIKQGQAKQVGGVVKVIMKRVPVSSSSIIERLLNL